MSGGFWVLGSCLTVSNLHFVGLVNIWRFSWIEPFVVVSGLKIFIFSGGPIAFFMVTALSSLVISSDRRWSSSWGLNFGAMSLRIWLALLKQAFGCVHPSFLYFLQLWHSHLVMFSILWVRSSSICSWMIRSLMVSTLCWVLRHLACELYSLCLAPGVLPMWCQAGSFILCSRDNLGTSRWRLYLAPMLRVLRISFGSALDVYLFFMYIVWRQILEMELSLWFFSCSDLEIAAIMIAIAVSEAVGQSPE